MTDAPTGNVTVSAMLPAPVAVHVPPPVPVHVQLGATSDVGRTSVTATPTASDGPALPATTVYVTGVPGTALTAPSVLVIDRSATGCNVSMSVAELLPGAGSVTPPGGATEAVLTRVPVDALEMSTVTWYVAWPPGTSEIESTIEPPPEGVHDDPAVALHVQLIAVAPAGRASETAAPVTDDGPALVTVTVYTVEPPGVATSVPSVLVTARSASATIVVVSVAELLAGVGSTPAPGIVTVAVFDSSPLKPGAMMASTTNVAVAPDRRSTVVAMSPLPEDELLLAERHSALRAAVSDLPPGYRELIVLLTADPPVSYAEISARLGIPIGSIGPSRSRCLARLRRHPAIAMLIDADARPIACGGEPESRQGANAC